jgi:hypothetical protein
MIRKLLGIVALMVSIPIALLFAVVVTVTVVAGAFNNMIHVATFIGVLK